MTRQPSQTAVSSSSTLWATGRLCLVSDCSLAHSKPLTATKDWVIPAKPKPGRKPKKDTPATTNKQDDDSKGRRVQNRAAQRAFRERKQSQLVDLQARLQSYESGEVERNVALQSVAKRLKEENEVLRRENSALKDQLSKAQAQLQATTSAQLSVNKRWRDEDQVAINTAISLKPATVIGNGSTMDTALSIGSSNDGLRKRLRIGTDAPQMQNGIYSSPSPSGMPYMPSPPSMASTPDSHDGHHAYSPMPQAPPSRPQSVFPVATPTNATSLIGFSRNSYGRNKDVEPPGSATSFDSPSFDCGLCDEHTPCVCREIALHHVSSGLSPVDPQLSQGRQEHHGSHQESQHPVLKIESIDQSSTVLLSQSPADSASSPASFPSGASILDNLPAYQPPVPLRRAAHPRTHNHTPIFQIRLPSPEPPTINFLGASHSSVPDSASQAPVCSGDPSNCLACADDAFGQAFCAAIGDSICSSGQCAGCPGNKTSKPATRPPPPPPAPMAPRSMGTDDTPITLTAPHAMSALVPPGSLDHGADDEMVDLTEDQQNSSRIPCSEAWRQLKSHPNIAFADLSMLAEVVARRTKCSGPHVEIQPALGSLTPERHHTEEPADRFEGGGYRFAATSVNASATSGSAAGASIAINSSASGGPSSASSRAGTADASSATSAANSASAPGATIRVDDSQPILLVDPHAQYRERQQQEQLWKQQSSVDGSSPGRTLVPHEILLECGRTRVREVDVAGVKEALRLLDGKFGRP